MVARVQFVRNGTAVSILPRAGKLRAGCHCHAGMQSGVRRTGGSRGSSFRSTRERQRRARYLQRAVQFPVAWREAGEPCAPPPPPPHASHPAGLSPHGRPSGGVVGAGCW